MPLLSENVSLKSLYTIWFQLNAIVFQLCDILEKTNYINNKKIIISGSSRVGEGMKCGTFGSVKLFCMKLGWIHDIMYFLKKTNNSII